MAAYAALVSVMHIIDDLQQHPHPPISLHKQQLESLTQNVTFLQDFLETFSFHNDGHSQEPDGLETRIADAAHAAEDIIESHIVDQILSGSTTHEENTCGVDLYEGLQKVIEDMDSIKEVAMKLKQDPRQRNRMPRSSTPSSTQQSNLMVGFDDVLLELMDKLTRGQPLRFIPIVGMGGIGKTTLARNVYLHETVVQSFDIRAWATISQDCILKEILLEVLHGVGKDREMLKNMNEHDLGEILHKHLFGRKYLLIMDDIWDIKIWEQLMVYVPNNNNGSRVVFTTRLSALAHNLSDSHGMFKIKLDFLSENDSWNLFCKIVFGEEDCPLELEKIGKKIVKSCRGLPLSINVIGGLLSVSAQTPQNWEHIAENLSSVVNLDDNEHCLKVLYTSYSNLPVYLKPCFLYMGVFREDSEIRVSHLIQMWVAEGFLKPKDGRSLEDVAEEYLGELVDRNLILVQQRRTLGKLKKHCKIHDLLRDLCLREARKQKFICVLGGHGCYSIPQDLNSERRICNYEGTELDSLSVVRSLIWKHGQLRLPIFGGRLLRLYETLYFLGYPLLQHLLVVSQRVNLRYINIIMSIRTFRAEYPNPFSGVLSESPCSISHLWNLQTLVVFNPFGPDDVPLEIWKMPRLRHVKIWSAFELPTPPTDDGLVLENLQTLSRVLNFKCGEEVVKRIPNIKKLRLYYKEEEKEEWRSREDYYCLSNIGQLHKLTTLCIENEARGLSRSQMQSLSLPHSLKQLTLSETKLQWEDMAKMVGSLPLLEDLRLRRVACEGSEWVTNEGQFCSLKLLEIDGVDLEYWETEKEHFPCLEHIILSGIKLKEVPSCVGDIDTLQSFTLRRCCRSACDSAQRIREEQRELGNLTPQFYIHSQDQSIDKLAKLANAVLPFLPRRLYREIEGDLLSR